MKITKNKILNIIKKYFPEYGNLKLKSNKEERFVSFIGENRIEYPQHVNGKMDNYSRNIVLMSSIFHEIGHLATTKKSPSTISELVATEANAQKWAIEKAIELKLTKLTKCLVEEFFMWQEEMDNSDHINPLYSVSNPYQEAYEQNEQWIEQKMNEVFI